MGNTSQWLEGSVLTEQQMMTDLRELAGFYDMLEVPNQLLEAGPNAPLPTLTAFLEGDEHTEVVTHSFLPLDAEEAEFTKFLQFYTEEPQPDKPIDRTVLLELACALNGALPLGSCFPIPPDQEKELPARLGIRWTQGYALNDHIDRGAFCESVFLFDTSCSMVRYALSKLAEGKSATEVLAEMR